MESMKGYLETFMDHKLYQNGWQLKGKEDMLSNNSITQ